MMHIAATSAERAIVQVREATRDAEVMNIVLTFPLELPASNSGILYHYRLDAQDWQNPTRPPDLLFNHGEYMHAHKDSVKYVIDELRRKPTSNRACISLVDTAPIMKSGDGPLPSFLLFQAGFDGPSLETLTVTAYYRALEATAFLPINITELALLSEQIRDAIPSISKVQVTMHAFRTHSAEGNSVHRRSKLDTLDDTELQTLITDLEHEALSEYVREKAAPTSIIEVSGLSALRVEAEAASWDPLLLEQIDHAISALERLRVVRTSATHGGRIGEVQEEVSEAIRTIADAIARK
jgi:hypothetical protein